MGLLSLGRYYSRHYMGHQVVFWFFLSSYFIHVTPVTKTISFRSQVSQAPDYTCDRDHICLNYKQDSFINNFSTAQ